MRHLPYTICVLGTLLSSQGAAAQAPDSAPVAPLLGCYAVRWAGRDSLSQALPHTLELTAERFDGFGYHRAAPYMLRVDDSVVTAYPAGFWDLVGRDSLHLELWPLSQPRLWLGGARLVDGALRGELIYHAYLPGDTVFIDGIPMLASRKFPVRRWAFRATRQACPARR